MLSFVSQFKLNLKKIPTYPDFEETFHIHVDRSVAQSILDYNTTVTTETRVEFTKILDEVDNNRLASKYKPVHGIGRYYAECDAFHYNHLGNMPKSIKDTLYDHGGFVDYDQVKGHATILYALACVEGIDLPGYGDYLTHFEDVAREMIEYYSTDVPLTISHIKDLFNATIYGGGHDGWIKALQTGCKVDKKGRLVERHTPMVLKNTDVPHDRYCRFKLDTDQLIQRIYASNPELQELVCSTLPDDDKHHWKRRNRVMSYFCGTLEHFITYQAYTYAHTNGMCRQYEVDWCFDGFTFQPACSHEQLVKHESLLNAYVRKQTGLSQITFIRKPFSAVSCPTFKIPGDIMDMTMFISEAPPPLRKCDRSTMTDKEKRDRNILEYQHYFREVELKARMFEVYHVKILQPPMFIRCSNRSMYMLPAHKLTEQYEHVQILKPGQPPHPVKFTDAWRARSSIKSYESFDFLPPPLPCPKTTLNTFTGLYAETLPDAKADISLMFYQLRLLCGENELAMEYVLNWIAHRVQRPGELPRSALVFVGEQGTGKNLFWEGIGIMIGKDYYLLTDNFEKVMGRFNMNQNKILLVMDEVRGKDGFEYSENIKALITTPTLAWEQKGLNPTMITNCAGMVFFSNGSNGTPVKIEYGDRRMSAYQCSSKHKGDADYFTKLAAFMNDKANLRTMYDYFKQRDISNWRPEQDRVLTDFYRELQSSNRPAMSVFLEERLLQYESAKSMGEETVTQQLATQLFTEFKSWLVENGFTKLDYNSNRFGREVTTYGLNKRHSRAGAMYTFEYTELRILLTKKGHLSKWCEVTD